MIGPEERWNSNKLRIIIAVSIDNGECDQLDQTKPIIGWDVIEIVERVTTQWNKTFFEE